MQYLIPDNTPSGIYKIISPDGFYYIGSTNNFSQRFQTHYTSLLKNKHSNSHIQNRFNKHPVGWKFTLLEYTSADNLLKCEEVYLKEHFGKEGCMNINPRAERPPVNRRKQSAEHIARILESKRRNGTLKHSEETKAKMRGPRATNGHQGMRRSEETKAKMRAAAQRKKQMPVQLELFA